MRTLLWWHFSANESMRASYSVSWSATRCRCSSCVFLDHLSHTSIMTIPMKLTSYSDLFVSLPITIATNWPTMSAPIVMTSWSVTIFFSSSSNFCFLSWLKVNAMRVFNAVLLTPWKLIYQLNTTKYRLHPENRNKHFIGKGRRCANTATHPENNWIGQVFQCHWHEANPCHHFCSLLFGTWQWVNLSSKGRLELCFFLSVVRLLTPWWKPFNEK